MSDVWIQLVLCYFLKGWMDDPKVVTRTLIYSSLHWVNFVFFVLFLFHWGIFRIYLPHSTYIIVRSFKLFKGYEGPAWHWLLLSAHVRLTEFTVKFACNLLREYAFVACSTNYKIFYFLCKRTHYACKYAANLCKLHLGIHTVQGR